MQEEVYRLAAMKSRTVHLCEVEGVLLIKGGGVGDSVAEEVVSLVLMVVMTVFGQGKRQFSV